MKSIPQISKKLNLKSTIFGDLQIKLLEDKNPLNDVWLKVRLLYKVLQCSIISKNYHLGIDQVGAKFLQRENGHEELFLYSGMVYLNLM